MMFADARLAGMMWTDIRPLFTSVNNFLGTIKVKLHPFDMRKAPGRVAMSACIYEHNSHMKIDG